MLLKTSWALAENSDPGAAQVLARSWIRLDTMNEESLAGTSSLYSSTFAQVIFVNIEKQYTTDVAVKCNYILTPRITPHKNDWIGIFKVGWSTARDYHTFVWAPLPKEAGQVERQQQVTFEAYYLPKDNNDFYQFCYVTQKGEIRGASTPFGFRLANSGTPDRLDSDSGQEMLVITTQEKLEETEREKDELRESNRRLTTENAALKGKINELKTQAAREEEEHSAALKVNQEAVLEMEKQVLEQKLKSELELKAQSEKQEQLRKVLTEKEAACLTLQMEKQDLLAEVESARSSAEQLKQKNGKAGEKLKQLRQENERLRAEISAKEAELTSLTEVKNKSASELKAAQERLQLVQFDFETKRKENVALKEDLMKLAEVRNEQQNCLAEISQLRQALSKSEELKASNASTVEKLQEQVGDLQQCLMDMEKQVRSAQQQQAQTAAELMVAQAGQEQSQRSLRDAQQEIQHWKYKFEKVDEIFSKSEGKCTELARELDVKTRALDVRDAEVADLQEEVTELQEEMEGKCTELARELDVKTRALDVRDAEVADLQEEIERLTKRIEELRPSTDHQSGAFRLEHANPYSMNVPTAHSAHPELLFGNPYFERGAAEPSADQFVDLQQDLNDLENFQDFEAELPVTSQKCPVCLFPFDPAMEESVMEQHISTHFGHDCPICEQHFLENQQTQYASHVQSHFAAAS
ncbi:tax1-binding protein 1 homolog B-like isoform X2 [Hypanus sabinus]|uniref:tax1-binding protein 1 homolog B-like isoform X2 n=1 Tax=Hypanus sabinus TaxID=79690 RepID=UPI0028C40A7F|nr:tax1-binding protein 1 homolog B-like isoform X2 [Hypanus sabinus]